MKQIMDTVSALGLTIPGAEDPAKAPELAEQVTSVLHQAQAQDQKQQALVRALMPYLRPGRQRRLERAMQLAQLSHLFALQGQIHPQPGKEAQHV